MPLEIGTTIDTGIDRPPDPELPRVIGPDGQEYTAVEHIDYGTSIRVRFAPDRAGLWRVEWQAEGVQDYTFMVVPRDPGGRRRRAPGGPATVDTGGAATRIG